MGGKFGYEFAFMKGIWLVAILPCEYGCKIEI